MTADKRDSLSEISTSQLPLLSTNIPAASKAHIVDKLLIGATQAPMLSASIPATSQTYITDNHLPGSTNTRHINHLQAYFAYLSRQCQEALVERGRYCSARSFQDLFDIAESIREGLAYTEILQSLNEKYEKSQKTVEGELLARAIELTARILSMHELGQWQGASGRHRLTWQEGGLKACLEQHYRQPELDESVKLESIFNAISIEKIAGFTIVWTDNLADHLTLYDLGSSQSVRIFHHITFLKNVAGSSQTIFPPGFLLETQHTLSLLFPHKSKALKKWLSRHAAKEELLLDKGLLACGRLSPADRHINKFHYWRDRLVILKQAFDEAEPSSISQWWHDRRKRVQWSTFWVALAVLVLTVVFGCIQSIEGALQVYKAYYPSQQ